MSDNVRVLLVGVSQMAIDYTKVLKALGVEYSVVGNSEKGVQLFHEKTGEKAIAGGIESYLHSTKDIFTHAIIATGVEVLADVTKAAVLAGISNVLVEKPAGIDFEEIEQLNNFNQNKYPIHIAYNRRFYQSVLKTKAIIEQDGGLQSFHFEFTEWSHVIEKVDKKPGIKDNWFLANSTHIVDLAFYIGGSVKEMKSFSSGQLKWHPKSRFVGSGITDKNVLFSYHSNWEAPGRWFAEFLTEQHRLILKPMEELHIQKKGSVQIEKYNLESTLDYDFKPGLYLQTEAFLNNQASELITLDQHTKRLSIFEAILNGN